MSTNFSYGYRILFFPNKNFAIGKVIPPAHFLMLRLGETCGYIFIGFQDFLLCSRKVIFPFLVLSVYSSKSLIPMQPLDYHQHIWYIQWANNDKLKFMDNTYSIPDAVLRIWHNLILTPNLCFYAWFTDRDRGTERLSDLSKVLGCVAEPGFLAQTPLSKERLLCRQFYLIPSGTVTSDENSYLSLWD